MTLITGLIKLKKTLKGALKKKPELGLNQLHLVIQDLHKKVEELKKSTSEKAETEKNS
jgi:hypothetical protein